MTMDRADPAAPTRLPAAPRFDDGRPDPVQLQLGGGSFTFTSQSFSLTIMKITHFDNKLPLRYWSVPEREPCLTRPVAQTCSGGFKAALSVGSRAGANAHGGTA